MLRIAALAAATLVLLPAAGRAAGPCQPGPGHPQLRALFEDLTTNEVLPGPPTVYAGHRIAIDARFDVVGSTGVIPGSVRISVPGAPVTSANAGHMIAVIPQAAGTLPVTFTWTETMNPSAPDPAPACEGSAEVPMTVREPRPATIRLRTVRSARRPRIDLKLALGFAANGDASPITLRARAVNGTTPPRTGLKRIATLPLDTVSRGQRKRIGRGSFGLAELFYSAAEDGGVATLRYTGKARRRGALSIELVQRGKTRARLRTGLVCRATCRTVGLRFTKP